MKSSIKRDLVFAVLLLTVFFIFGCESKIRFPLEESNTPDEPQVYAESYLTKTRTFAGEKVRLNLNVWHPENVLPKISDFVNSSGEIEVVDSGEYSVSSPQGITKKIKWYDLNTNIEGVYIVPGFKISYRENEKVVLINTSSIYVEVFNEENNYMAFENVRDIKPLYKPEENRNLILLIGMPALILISVVFLLFYFFKFRSPAEESEDEEMIFAHETALEKYYAVKKDAQEKGIYPKEFCFKLSVILRNYIFERWEIEPLQMTSSEIITRLKKINDIEYDDFRDAEKLISIIELIKFTSVNLQEEWLERIEEAFLSFIRNTKKLKPEEMIASTEI